MANLFNFQVMIKFSHILCVSSAYLVDLLTMYILIQYTILDFNHRHFFLLCFLGGTSSSSVLYSFNVPLILIYIHTIALILVKSWHHRWCSNDNSQLYRSVHLRGCCPSITFSSLGYCHCYIIDGVAMTIAKGWECDGGTTTSQVNWSIKLAIGLFFIVKPFSWFSHSQECSYTMIRQECKI